LTTPIADAILGMCRLDQQYNDPSVLCDKNAVWELVEQAKAKVEKLMTQAAAQAAQDTAEAHDLAGPVPRAKVPACPHQKVLALWAEVLPELPQHTQWTDTRRKHLQARWRETAVQKKWESEEQGLHYFRRLFGYLKQSDFLMGRAATQGRRTFTIELEWLINPSNWAKVIEGKYHA